MRHARNARSCHAAGGRIASRSIVIHVALLGLLLLLLPPRLVMHADAAVAVASLADIGGGGVGSGDSDGPTPTTTSATLTSVDGVSTESSSSRSHSNTARDDGGNSSSSSSSGKDNDSQPLLDAAESPEPQHIPLVRLPSNTLLKYSAYKDVSILHFRIPADTRTALFSFKAYDESNSAFQRGCEPRDVSLHLKAGSYPVISPENITFPPHFLSADQRFDIHHLQFKSDGTTKRLSIDGPQPDNWFAVAYISWTDPNNDRIEQQGLASSCETLLLSEMAIVQENPIILSPTLWHNGTVHSGSAAAGANTSTPPPVTTSTAAGVDTYKFFVPRDVNAVLVHIRIHSPACTADCAELLVRIQANALPSARSHMLSTVVPVSNDSDGLIDLYPHQDAWHYLDIGYLDVGVEQDEDTETETEMTGGDEGANNATRVEADADEEQQPSIIEPVQYSVRIEFVHDGERIEDVLDVASVDDTTESYADILTRALPQRMFEYHTLLRQTYREFFMFDYDLLHDENGTVPAYLNLTAGHTTGFRFKLGDVYDIGGTLSFAVAMRETIRENIRIRTTAAASASAASSSASGGAVAEKLVGSSASTSTVNGAAATAVNEAAAATAAGSPKVANRTAVRVNQTVIVCMRLGEPGIPTWPDQCLYGRKYLPAASVINNTNDDTSTGLVHVPFPETGEWFVTMGLFCEGDETGAVHNTVIDSVKEFVRQYAGDVLATPDNDTTTAMLGGSRPCPCGGRATYWRECVANATCLSAMSETEALRVKECLMDSRCTVKHAEMAKRFEQHHRFASSAEQQQTSAADAAEASACNASALFTISSSPCVAGRCGRFGRCYHYMSGGFVFSTCLCVKGYRGWDCTEDTQVPSGWSILLALLLLTLSNLLFIPSIYFGIRRKYYTESVIYFFAMFFSIFYHACDSGEDEYGFCLVKIGVLQFCDFYCGLLAIWVTLIAMAHVRPTFVSLLHMFGAIVLAFGTELNKQSLWVFLAPALTGLCIISVSWGLRCRRTRTLFPSRRYLAVFLPVGAVLVMVGLVCYAFLQTRQNYHIVHSVWHMVMALSILCLLPGRETFLPKC